MITEQKRLQNVCILEDSRNLVYDIYGDMDGFPYFYFHGYPCSRLEARCIHEEATEKNIKLISIDRPGFGLSDFQKNRTIIDWSKDILSLSEELNIQKFGIVSYSAGAPYALACGYRFPEKLVKVVILAALGGGDFQQPGLKNDHKAAFRVAGHLPYIYRCIFWWSTIRRIKGKSAAKRYYRSNLSNFALKDQELFQNSDILNQLIEIQCESCRQGMKGVIHEAILLGKPWGVDLSSISSNLKIHIWHGTADLIAPVTASKEIERMLPKCTTHYKENEGHYSLIFNHNEEILDAMGSL